MNYYLNIGTNLGNRRGNLYRAVVALTLQMGNIATSRIVASKPWGYHSNNEFLNVGVLVRSHLQPHDMLQRLQALERKLGSGSHRDEQGNYADRVVDIDIIAIDDLVIDTPTLQVPHPRMHLRPFVLQPMAQLAPTWRHPVLHATAAQLLERLSQQD